MGLAPIKENASHLRAWLPCMARDEVVLGLSVVWADGRYTHASSSPRGVEPCPSITRPDFLQHAASAAAVFGASSARFTDAQSSRTARSTGAGIDPMAIRRLSAKIRGHVDLAMPPTNRTTHLQSRLRPPSALIVRCADASDIARAIAFGRDQRIPLAARSGGHSRRTVDVRRHLQ